MNRRALAALVSVAAFVALAVVPPHLLAADDVAKREERPRIDAAALAYTYGTGAFRTEYTPPPVGSYTLPAIDDVGDHALVESDGHATSLHALTKGRAAVVAFVYTTCAEAAGCPLSMAVLGRLDGIVGADPELSRSVVLVTISFDPERDTPERLAEIRAAHRPRANWRFATTAGSVGLESLLEDFGQPVSKLRYADGAWTGFYRHVLKVFLVDRAHQVRNIYSAGFLDPDIIVNDLRTVLERSAS